MTKLTKCKCGRERDGTKRVKCCEPGCNNLVQNVHGPEDPYYRPHPNLSFHTDESCCVCTKHHQKMNDFFGEYRFYRLPECANVDGRLGFKCKGVQHIPERLRAGILEVDHKYELHDNDTKKKGNKHIWVKNLKTLCAVCHKIKTLMVVHLDQHEPEIRYMLSFEEHAYDTDDECIDAIWASKKQHGKGVPKETEDNSVVNLVEQFGLTKVDTL